MHFSIVTLRVEYVRLFVLSLSVYTIQSWRA